MYFDSTVGFTTPYTRLDRLSMSRDSVLVEDLSYRDKRGRLHTARAGMLFDGGSIPRRLWRLIDDPYGMYLQAYVIHDWYCLRSKALNGKERWKLRREADMLFDEMLDWLGCPRLKRQIMVAGVKIGAYSTQWRVK